MPVRTISAGRAALPQLTGIARLRALRLIGFKSFAERTVVEFGPGISAIVGPNGSGKSNLADALRWTLGEQGRLLRTRRSEDVIFAGSSSRRAIGMADVTLVVDNEDRLLPLDYGEVEIGRRLYRSGENEYLLNRQRIRLRDLGELLDAANLADNAFLFIGQGMVDQALALRPEERRPLFEEAAGVRRHERRRRQAEAELAEAEANLERVRDVLGELRPQVRRLAAQAQQLEARRSAGLELAEALVNSARARWIDSWQAAQAQQQALDQAHAESDAEMTALRNAEEASERHSGMLAQRAERESHLRSGLETHRNATVELRLRQARMQGDGQALRRDRVRLEEERATLEIRMLEARRQLGEPLPPEDLALAQRMEQLERQLAEVEASLLEPSTAGAERQPAEQERARQAALATECEQLRRRLSVAEHSLATAEKRAAELGPALVEAEVQRAQTVERLQVARAAEAQAEEAAQDARKALEQASGRRGEAARPHAELERQLAAAGSKLSALAASLEAADNVSLVRAARARGGSLLAEGLEVDPGLRRAVSAALGDGLRGVLVDAASVAGLREYSGVLLTRNGSPSRAPGSDAVAAGIVAAATNLGGDRLATAIRRDPLGHVTRLLERCVWVPELDDALALRPNLSAGWKAVSRAGEVVSDEGVLRLAEKEDVLEQRAALDEQARTLGELERQLVESAADVKGAEADESAAVATVENARVALDRTRVEARAAEEAERSAQRRADGVTREEGWARAELDRQAHEAEELRQSIARAEAGLAAFALPGPGSAPGERQQRLEQRRDELRSRRDQMEAQTAEIERRRTAAEEARRRAEVSLALAEARSLEIDAEVERIARRDAEHAAQVERLEADLSAAQERERRAAAELEQVLGEEAQDRRQLLESERAANAARERLRRAEGRSRSAEVAVMEARLHLEQVREQLLVELASIGSDGLLALRGSPATGGAEAAPAPDELGAGLESALEAAVARWSAEPGGDPPPSSSRLAALRRQFHSLGAGNPFAVEEYAEVRERLETLEAQRGDLETAMDNTRQLIASLSRMITEQFLATFAALEDAFASRFEQLFGGGEAQLSLTLPEDLSATGVEITARPPGKKRQPLAMLSGGERALTAVALLLAMLEVRPVPFCVLDEVDAALDEANITRFSAALRGLADRIQFIVITHNRGTIETADALYGVTLGEDAVSRIVSLRLPPLPAEGKTLAEVPIVPLAAPAEAGRA